MNTNTDEKELKDGEPVVAYLKGLNNCGPVFDNDGTKMFTGKSGYIQQLAECVTVESGTEHIRDKIFRMWMIMACAAADHAEQVTDKKVVPKFDSMMIFVGNQGIGKTRFFRAMLPKQLQPYFDDGVIIDLTNNLTRSDSISRYLLKWIVEISNLELLSERHGINRFDHFLSGSIDTFRESYENNSKNYQRRTVFVGSTNDKEFLNNRVMNRRYWPLSVEELTMPNVNLVDNAWCEAWTAYINGEQWWPQPNIEKELLSKVASFQIPD